MALGRRPARLLFGVLFGAAALLRLTHPLWDEGTHLHPDERFISMVEEKLQWPSRLGDYFDSSRSTLDPYNRGEGSFVYGTLPLLLARAAGRPFGLSGYGGTFIAGRVLSAVFDLASVWLAYLLTRRFAGRGTALVAAGLLAFCPLGIQLSHFWAVDTYLTAFGAAALYGCVRHALHRSGWAGDCATGVAVGLAVACKITALALFGPVGLAILVRELGSGWPRGARSWAAALGRMSARFAAILLCAIAAVRVAFPHAFLGPSPFSLRLDPRWIEDIRRLNALGVSFASFPPAFQWADRSALFPVKNFVLWGASPFFGLAALGSLVWSVVAIVRRRRWALAPLAAHAVFLLAYHSVTLAKAMRYWYPAYPDLAVLGALFLGALSRRFWTGRGLVANVLRLSPAIALAGTFLAGLAFSRIYTRPLTRIAASDWIYAHVPLAPFAGEAWDDGLPIPRPGFDNAGYHGPSLPLVDPDNTSKAETLLQALKETRWIAVTSNRVYNNLTRLPDVYPMSIAYYRALFDGRLGFERAADFTSYPSLGPIRFPDDGAEEQFTVYDHPRVLLFRKSKSFSLARARSILLSALSSNPPTIAEWEKWPRSKRRVTEPVRPGRSREAEGKSLGAASGEVETRISSLWACVVFYLAALAIGLAALPMAWTIFPKLADRGAGVARILGVVAGSYLLMLLVRLRVVANGRPAAVGALAVVAAVGVALFARRRREILAFLRERRRMLRDEEIAFAAGFVFFVAMRSLNAEIFWGEKPMDFSILNILVRTRTIPPSDPWFAGAPLGYYAFGQEMIAFVSLVTGLSTRFTFNLAFGWIGGTLLQAAYSLLANWTGTRRAGIAGACFAGVLGNLAGLREWLVNQPAAHQPRHLDWHYFWATSRVIPNTINEYPFWSLLFADLHAHVFAFPLFLLFASAALNFVRVHADPRAGSIGRIGAALLLGFAAAAQALTNAWDVPLLAGLLVLTAAVAAFARRGWSARASALLSLAVAGGSALVLVAPLWVHGGGAPGRGSNGEPGATGLDILTVFGLFFFLVLGWWLASARRRLVELGWSRRAATIGLALLGLLLAFLAVRAPNVFCAAGVLLFLAAAMLARGGPEDRLAFAFAGTGFFLIYFAQHYYIADRMNTFFKLYLEAWLVLAVASAALAFRPSDRPGSISRWALPGKLAFGAIAAAALFTTVTVARGAVDARLGRPAPRDYRSDPEEHVRFGGPTLDGLKYLEVLRPGEYRAVVWLRRAFSGTPVVLEAQGESYQDFGRISMFTGLPTVLGWEYHVQQRGNPQSEIEERKDAVKKIYATPNLELTERLLRRYHVGYVYLGWLERQTYPAAGLAKFRANPELFGLVYENREVQIYRVAGGEGEDALVPTREQIPAVPSASDTEPEEAPVIAEKARDEGAAPFAGMREPRDAAVDPSGRLWVADFGNSRVRVFDREGGFLGGWGGRGAGVYGLREACGVAIRGSDVYVADTWNGRIQHYTIRGEWKGTAPGLYGPRGVAVASDGSVWATDTGNNRVIQYDGELQQIRAVGKPGSGPGQFTGPVGIATGLSGGVYVADTGNRRIVVLDDAGEFRRAVPFSGWSDGGEPHLEVDSSGHLHVTDPGANAVVELDPSGTILERRTRDDAGKEFSRPTGVAIDRGNAILYVVNSGNNTISTVRLVRRKKP